MPPPAARQLFGRSAEDIDSAPASKAPAHGISLNLLSEHFGASSAFAFHGPQVVGDKSQ